ncbi:MAG: LytR family transcriptional regulator [Armatimonadetes bacterium]|nr:LytR family transcriptional regulator [Armatimonadota bacterium]
MDATADHLMTTPARPRYTWKRLVVFCFTVFVLAVCILAAGFYYIVGIRYPEGENPIKQIYNVWQNPGSVAFRDKARLNILCLGVDYNTTRQGIRYTKWARSDTIFVISVDREAHSLNVLSIPRDVRAEIPGHGFDKINAAFSMKEMGDLQLSRATVEHLLGVPMDHTIVIKEYAASRLVDAIGGVTVTIDKDMDYDDNWGNLHIHLKQGVRRLNGEQAVGFVRFRHDEEGDRGRIRRQQQFLDALMKELRKPQNLTPNNVREMARAIKENIDTTLSFGEILDIAATYKNFNRKNMVAAKVDGADVDYDGISFIEPDEHEKQRLVSRMLLGLKVQEPEDIKVEILNGSDIPGAAERLANIFRDRGYNVVNVGDAVNPVEPESHMITHHDDNDDTCRGIEKTFFGQIKVYFDPKDTRSDVTVVIGHDWATRYKAYEDRN